MQCVESMMLQDSHVSLLSHILLRLSLKEIVRLEIKLLKTIVQTFAECLGLFVFAERLSCMRQYLWTWGELWKSLGSSDFLFLFLPRWSAVERLPSWEAPRSDRWPWWSHVGQLFHDVSARSAGERWVENTQYKVSDAVMPLNHETHLSLCALYDMMRTRMVFPLYFCLTK